MCRAISSENWKEKEKTESYLVTYRIALNGCGRCLSFFFLPSIDSKEVKGKRNKATRIHSW